MKKLFYDLETTGVDYRKQSIHEIAGIIEIDNIYVEKIIIHTRPHPKAVIEPEALKKGGVTLEQIMAYQDMKEAYNFFTKTLSKYVNVYDPKDKIYLVGFNNRYFDDVFLRKWFEQNGNPMIGAYFWNDSLDVLVLACQYLLGRRANMPSFKLRAVARELGIEVDNNQLHKGDYDVYLTRKIYRIVTGIDLEI